MARGLSLVRGAAAGAVAGSLVFGVVLFAGLAAGGSRLIFLGGAAAGVVFGLIEQDEGRIQAVGASVIGVGALVVGVLTGFGRLEWSAVVGSVLAAVWLWRGEPRPTRPWSWFRWGGAILVFLVLVLLPLIVNGGALGHDEAAYAVKAKAWLEGTPDTGWFIHRGTAMSVYGYVVLAVGGAEPGLRLLGLAGALTLAVGVWFLAEGMASPRVAAVASVAVVAGPAILMRSTEYLSDVPSAALLVFCMVIVWREFTKRDLPSYRLVWVVPLAWAAFYLRYQSVLSLALIGLVVLALWWPKVKERRGPIIAVAAIGLLGLIPHALYAVDTTGTPWGILTFTSGAAGRAYLGEGLVDYLLLSRWALAGFVGPIVIVAGIAGLVAYWGRFAERRRFLFVLVPAALQVLVLGVILHGESRFIFFPLALVVVAGCIAIDGWIPGLRPNFGLAATWFLVVLLVGSLGVSAAAVRRSVDHRALVNQPVEAAGLIVAAEADRASCGVLTSYGPQVTFYSECATDIFRDWLEPESAVARLDGDTKFMVLIEPGKRQPVGEDLNGLVELAEPPTPIDGELADAYVYPFVD